MSTYVTLNNGIKMPKVGFGVYLVHGEECFKAVKNALEVGYRHIDTAQYLRMKKKLGKPLEHQKYQENKYLSLLKLRQVDILLQKKE